MSEIVREIRAVELALPDGLASYPDLVGIYEYWLGKCGQSDAPEKEEIDPLEFVSVLPQVMLADVGMDEAGMLEFRYRLSGTGICDVHGFEPTGLTTKDLAPPEYGALIWKHYCQCVEERRPLAHIIILNTSKKARSYARILLPLLDEDGAVTTLMTVDSKQQNTLRKFLEEIEAIGGSGPVTA